MHANAVKAGINVEVHRLHGKMHPKHGPVPAESARRAAPPPAYRPPAYKPHPYRPVAVTKPGIKTAWGHHHPEAPGMKAVQVARHPANPHVKASGKTVDEKELRRLTKSLATAKKSHNAVQIRLIQSQIRELESCMHEFPQHTHAVGGGWVSHAHI